jgi:hypothetical protein
MIGAEDGVVNLDEMLFAIKNRMLPGAQILLPGSPYAPFGPVYDMVQEFFGKPTKQLVVVRSTGPMMNPAIWTDEKIAESKLAPDAWRVDGLGDFMNPVSGLMLTEEVEACRRTELVVPRVPRVYYAAAMDPATRVNAWTLVVRGNLGEGKHVISLARQWQGSQAEPLKPSEVFSEMAPLLVGYGVTVVHTDQWAIDALQDTASKYGLWLSLAPAGFDTYKVVQALIAERNVEIPPDPIFVRDLASIRRKVTQNGATIELPKTADGRHCDYAPAMARVCSVLVRAPDPEPQPTEGAEAERLRAAAEREAARLEVERAVKKQSRLAHRRGEWVR